MQNLLPPELAALAAQVIEQNRKIGRRITVAESCTGGLVAAALTEVAGSSDVFDCGFITYSNDAKQSMVGVSGDLLETFGAVSIAVAWEMAQGALERSGCDVAVAITGVAGPGGGTEKKPVGTVVFAKAEKGKSAEDVVADRKNFGDDQSRADIRFQAVRVALELLLPEESA
ncbi:CinA family protein [Sphingorhabdus sp. 109]|jgi:nicotinamide-nucleotide amidase|uniref:CinA family protein n=1 Tax=Sphingorhabdus sp. 109 TaxID=2653173 RepID=UPI0012F400B1|nr:CinA family protein [Sphingorhabdus sp. 109]VWX57366.1 Competence protein [Sphingorhabdus sp. 109]